MFNTPDHLKVLLAEKVWDWLTYLPKKIKLSSSVDSILSNLTLTNVESINRSELLVHFSLLSIGGVKTWEKQKC